MSAGGRRTTWLPYASVGGSPDGIYYVNDDGTGPVGTGPLTCNLSACATPFRAEDVVPDPTADNALIAICDSSMSNVRHVVRFDDGGNCTMLYDGTQLATSTYPAALAVIETR
jgi:hypothetical protein